MTNRVVLGAFDGTFVLRISKPGFNVLDTALSDANLSFDSRWSSVGKVWMKGVLPQLAFTQFSSGGSPSVKASFGLGYTPAANAPPVLIAMMKLAGSSQYRPIFGLESYVVGSTMNIGISFFSKPQIDAVYYLVWRPLFD
ncbi:hypothetical protein B7L88_gp019 [Rhizobium phage RHEph10]|uniref:hypothetical protein n=1 Tax=Rhizobium phage RHEph10 TaxID=1220717 RepID=UPI0002AB01E0|nr:hypothetical protein B7L88_gp019 [Rhizobium phage RHEph10]AGC36063.1 hypothetical protein RHEph10_gp019 [Rhizobium phage RHEph10]